MNPKCIIEAISLGNLELVEYVLNHIKNRSVWYNFELHEWGNKYCRFWVLNRGIMYTVLNSDLGYSKKVINIIKNIEGDCYAN